MKYAQKLVLVPIEEWDKVKQKDLPLKQVMVNTLPQKVAISQQVKVTPQQGLGRIHVKNPVEEKLKEMILSLSPKRRMKALTILKLIKKSKDFSWAENGEFIYKGKSILLSDIKNLIIHTLQNTNDKPKGMSKFYKALSTLDLPKNIIVNKTGRSLIKKFKNDNDDLWRPPGKLNRKFYKK